MSEDTPPYKVNDKNTKAILQQLNQAKHLPTSWADAFIFEFDGNPLVVPAASVGIYQNDSHWEFYALGMKLRCEDNPNLLDAISSGKREFVVVPA